MPDAKTHDAINLYAAPLVGMAAYAATQRIDLAALAVAGHVFGTIYLSPDLDLVGGSIDDRWGVFRFIWRPYGWLVRHRSAWSHSGVSALIRLVYLAVVMEVFGLWLAGMGVIDLAAVNAAVRAWIAANADRAGAFVAGVVVSDAMHTGADLLSTWAKARGRNRSYRRELARHSSQRQL